MQLHMYDFDGTLFKSPDAPDGESVGRWLTNKKSLGPPCVPEVPPDDWWNLDVVNLATASIENPNAIAIVITGRDESVHQKRVSDLLKTRGLFFEAVHLNPGYYTEEFKITKLLEYLERHSEIDSVHIWEDNEDHLVKFCEEMVGAGVSCNGHLISMERKECAGGDAPVEIRIVQRFIQLGE